MPKAALCRARVAAIRWLAGDVLEVDLAMVEPPDLEFRAGQWIAIPVDDRTVRPYSMASPPSERRLIRLGVDVEPGGVGSRYFRALALDQEVRFRPPQGTLTLIDDSPAPILMIGEEIGVVPFRSILLGLAEAGFPRPVVLHFTAGARDRLLYHDELLALAAAHDRFRYRPLLSAPDPVWSADVGSVLEAVLREEGELRDRDGLFCGSGALVKAARELCLDRGMERKRIRYEKFW